MVKIPMSFICIIIMLIIRQTNYEFRHNKVEEVSYKIHAYEVNANSEAVNTVVWVYILAQHF